MATAAVSAGVVEREELAVDVEQGNLLALHLDQTRLTRPDLSCPRCLHKVSHRSFPSITFLSFIQPTHAGTRSNGGGQLRGMSQEHQPRRLLRNADAEVARSTNSSIDTSDATMHSLARRRSRGWVNGAHAGTYHRLQH